MRNIPKLNSLITNFPQVALTPIALIFFILLSIGCTGNSGVKPISPKQAEMLRSKYEVLLFNYLMTRGEWPMDKRYRSIKQMAEEGFEPAALALELFDIEHTDLKKNDRSAQVRLEQLAEQGNPTAQCLYAFYWNHQDMLDEKGLRWRRYVAQASDHGVAHCMYLRSIYLEKGNLKEQVNLEFEAAHKGDFFAQSRMASFYEKGDGVDKNWDKAVCWSKEAKKSESPLMNANYLNLIFFYKQENPDGLDRLTPEFCKAAISAR